MSIVNELIQQALALPVEDRAAIVERLLHSMEPGRDRVRDSSWQSHLESRLAAADAGDFYDGTMADLLADIRRTVADRSAQTRLADR